jgi:hypothetical protein
MSLPLVLTVQPENIPDVLKNTDRWGLWCKEKDKQGGRYDKIPIHPETGFNTNAHNPDAWRSIDEALKIYEGGQIRSRKVSGISFDLPTEPEPISHRPDGTPLYLIGLDFDLCVTEADGKPVVSDEVQEVLKILSSPYNEISPSGTGIRAFVTYPKPLKGGNKDQREMYSKGRFLTVTGHGSGDIIEAPEVLEQLEQEWFSKPKRPKESQNKRVGGNSFGNAGEGFELPDVIQEGERNDTMLAFVGSLRGKGIPESILALAVRQANQDRFKPPLDDDELQDLIDRYADQARAREGGLSVNYGDWPDPVPVKFGLPSVPSFQPNLLPDAYRPLDSISGERTQCPADFNVVGQGGAETENWVQEFNAKYAWVEGPKSIYRFEFGDFIKQNELVIQYKNDPLVSGSDNAKEKQSCRVAKWISHPARAEYRDLVFAPAEPAVTSKNEINMWTDFAVAPAAGSVEPYKKLRDYLFPETQECRYVEQWLAHKLKYPGVKMNTALVVWSQLEGVGKNMLFETVGDIIGAAHSCVIGQKDLIGNFNSWAKNRLFVIGDEVLGSGARKEVDQLKGLITGTYLRINEKNQPEYEIANHTSFVFLSNHGDAVHLENDSRRFFVSEIKATPLAPEFYVEYAAWRDNGGLAALHHYLINDVDLTGFDPKAPAPMTEAKNDMVSAGRSGLEQWMADVLEDPVEAFGGAVITAEILKLAYEHANGDTRSSTKAVGNAAKKAGGQPRGSQVRLTGGKKARVMSLVDHDEWAARSEAEWAEELERVKKHKVSI